MLAYREDPPDPRLAPWVRCIWHLRARGPGRTERLLPDGCMELVFHLGIPFARVQEDGPPQRQTSGLVAGVTRRAVLLVPSAEAEVVGVRFEPGGAAAFLDPPLQRWFDRIEPLESAEDPAWDRLHQRLHETPDPGRSALIEAFLLRRLAKGKRRGPVGLAAGEALRHLARPGATVEAAADLAGLGLRQFERRCLAEAGVPPRELVGLARLQRAAELLEGRLPLAEVALSAGFSDQAHLGRVFRDRVGTTPAAYRREAHDLAAAFVTGGA